MAEKEHKDLTCSVCLEEFKEPKVLPCCHTFCKGCLERILEKSGQKKSVICPQCKAEHQVPEVAFPRNDTGHFGIGFSPDTPFPADARPRQTIPVSGVDAFLTDFTVLQTFRIRSLTTKRESCGMCSDQDTPPLSFCEECEEYLCKYCNGAHKRMKVFVDHNVVALSEFKLESFIPKPKPYYCQQHPQNIVRFFCQTCNQLICESCVFQSQNQYDNSRPSIIKHNRHIVTTLSDGLKPMEGEFKELVDSADCDRKRYESNLNALEAMEEQREHYTQQLKAQVNTAVDLYIECLQASRVQTLKEIDAIFAESSEESKYNQTQKQHLRSAVSHINSGLKFGLKALQCHDDTERIAMIGQAMSQLQQPDRPHIVQIKPPLVVKDLEGTLQVLLQEFKPSDIHLLHDSSDYPNPLVQLGKKSQLKVTICLKPFGNPQFLIKYGSYYQFSLRPQTTLESDSTWLLEFTPCCGGRHAVSACVHGVWINCSAGESIGVSTPTFYVEGWPEEGDIVRRVPDSDWLGTLKSKETGKVIHSCHKVGTSSREVQVRWIKGEKEYD